MSASTVYIIQSTLHGSWQDVTRLDFAPQESLAEAWRLLDKAARAWPYSEHSVRMVQRTVTDVVFAHREPVGGEGL